MSQIFQSVETLTESDEEGSQGSGSKPTKPGSTAQELRAGRKSAKRKRQEISEACRQRLTSEPDLRKLLLKSCAQCNRRCLEKFKGRAKFEELQQFRQEWTGLHKLDQDQLAFDRIGRILAEERDEGVPPKWQICGVQVCLKAWKRLHALGYFVTIQIHSDVFCFSKNVCI